jgi:hypothetical protein
MPAGFFRTCARIVIALGFLFAAIAGLSVCASAQNACAPDSSTTITIDRETLIQLAKRMEMLESKMSEMAASHAKVLASLGISSPAERAPALQPAVLTKPASPAGGGSHEHQEGVPDTTQDGLPPGLPALQIRGFADMEFRASDSKGQTSTFLLGQFDLFITSRLSDRLSVLSEVVIENGPGNRFWIDIERLMLQYTPRDYFNLGIGRYHTGIGYYNTAYHHGSWFETATSRPFIFAFEDEGGVLPIHNVGVSANGQIPSGKPRLGYLFEVGNGRRSFSPDDEPVQNAADQDNHKAWNAGLTVKPEWVPGLQAGVSVYRDRFRLQESPSISQTITAVHAVIQNPKFEFLNEFLVIRNSPDGLRTFHVPGFYTQMSRQFGAARPYFRYDYINAPEEDPIYGYLERRSGPSAGLRYDVSEFASFKVEYKRTGQRKQSSTNAMTLQLAFTF